MNHQPFLVLDGPSQEEVLSTLSRPRLSKYLTTTNDDVGRALELYTLNAKVSAALMVDLHYVEIALRNKFDFQLIGLFGSSWFSEPQLLALADGRMQDILQKAMRMALRQQPKGQALLPGKVIAELSFGFWLQLTDRQFEHSLWTKALSKSFAPRKAPKRSEFNELLEKLRQLRNRAAHHEPVFHLDLSAARSRTRQACELLCPATSKVMEANSTLEREVTRITQQLDRWATGC